MQILIQTHTCFHAGLIGTGFALSILSIVTCKTGIISYQFLERKLREAQVSWTAFWGDGKSKSQESPESKSQLFLAGCLASSLHISMYPVFFPEYGFGFEHRFPSLLWSDWTNSCGTEYLTLDWPGREPQSTLPAWSRQIPFFSHLRPTLAPFEIYRAKYTSQAADSCSQTQVFERNRPGLVCVCENREKVFCPCP